MARIYNKMTVDITKSIPDIITAKQHDAKSRFLDVILSDNGKPIDLTGHEVRIYGKKADGKEFFNNGEITDAAGGRCQFELTSQALAVANDLRCEITLWKNNEELLTTPTFVIHVVKNLRTSGAIESANEYGALVVLYQNLYEAWDLMTEMVEKIGKTNDTGGSVTAGSVNAKLNCIQTKIADLDSDVSSFRTVAAKEATVSDISQRIGQTGNTGGTTTAGSVFGKLNALLTRWTQARAGYVDTIYNATNASSVISATGSLSQKLNFIIDNLTTGQAKQWKLETGSQSLTTSAASATLWEKNGTGVLQAVTFVCTSTSPGQFVNVEIEVDGVVICSNTENFYRKEAGNRTICYVAPVARYYLASSQYLAYPFSVVSSVDETLTNPLPSILNITFISMCLLCVWN